MPNRSCPHCARRLPYAGRRCIHCGWTVGSADFEQGAGVVWWRRARTWAVALALMSAVAAQFAYRNANDLADWYAGFAARFLPDGASSFAPTDTEPGAFFYCARQVSKKMDGEFSVETFDAAGSTTVPLGGGRYRIESAVEQASQSGQQVRHGFVCTVRFEGGRWVLEELKVDRFAEATTLPTVAAIRP
jgi:hypothetical protein